MWCVTEPYVSLPWPSSFAASARTFDAVGSIATSLTVGARSDSGVRTMLTYTSQNWVHWDSTAARSAASPAGSPLSVPAVGLGLVTAELCGAELCEGDADAVDGAVDVDVAGSSVSMLTPEADVQPARPRTVRRSSPSGPSSGWCMSTSSALLNPTVPQRSVRLRSSRPHRTFWRTPRNWKAKVGTHTAQ